MLYPTEAEWENWGIRDDVHRFFALHWTELFDHETADSWQVRTCNIRTILEELVDAARTAATIDAYRNVIRALFDEAFSKIRDDVAVKRLYPFVGQYLNYWRNRDIAPTDIAEVERVALVVLGNLDDYWRGVKAIVLEMLEAANGRRKRELYDAAINLAVNAAARGHSPEYLREAFITRVLAQSQQTFVERVRDMLEAISTGASDYECVFSTDGLRHNFHGRILPTDLTFRVGPPSAPDDAAELQFYQRANQRSVYVVVRTAGVDPEAARHAAEQRLSEVFASLNLYGVEDQYGVNHPDVLVIGADDGKRVVSQSRTGVSYLSNTRMRRERAERLFRVQERLGRDDSAQLMSALQYHRLALTSTSDEARFMNLWVALEAMCQGGEGSIIGRVCKRVPPVVALSNARKTLTSLAKYVRFLWNDGDKDRFLALFPGSREDQLRPEDLLRVLLLPDGDPELGELTRLVLRHPLICHRLFRAHSHLLDGPEAVAGGLDRSRQNVEWQIQRIYRVRNEIVHRGRSRPPQLRPLTQHLHSYLIKTVQSVVFELDRQPRWTIRDALEHQERLFNHLRTFLRSTPRDQISQETLLNPMKCLVHQGPPFAWAAAGPPEAVAPAAVPPPASAEQPSSPGDGPRA